MGSKLLYILYTPERPQRLSRVAAIASRFPHPKWSFAGFVEWLVPGVLQLLVLDQSLTEFYNSSDT